MDNKDLLSLPKDEFMRRKIVAAIKELLRRTSFQKVSVTRVCEQAGIARSSFYHLFDDLSDALDWDTSQLFSMAFEKYPFRTAWREDLTKQIIAFMEYRLEDATVYKKIASVMSMDVPGTNFYCTREKRIQSLLDIIEMWQGKPADEKCAFEVEFYVCGESATIANWLRSMKEAPEVVAKNIVGCIPAYLGQVLDTSFAAYQKRLANGNE